MSLARDLVAAERALCAAYESAIRDALATGLSGPGVSVLTAALGLPGPRVFQKIPRVPRPPFPGRSICGSGQASLVVYSTGPEWIERDGEGADLIGQVVPGRDAWLWTCVETGASGHCQQRSDAMACVEDEARAAGVRMAEVA